MTDDLSYYRRRAEAELEQAQRATKPEAARVHRALADAYLDRIHQLERAPDRTDLKADHGIRSFLIAQSPDQIENAYRQDNTILDNRHVGMSVATALKAEP